MRYVGTHVYDLEYDPTTRARTRTHAHARATCTHTHTRTHTRTHDCMQGTPRKATFVNGDLSDFSLVDGRGGRPQYDLVMMNDVIEHVIKER